MQIIYNTGNYLQRSFWGIVNGTYARVNQGVNAVSTAVELDSQVTEVQLQELDNYDLYIRITLVVSIIVTLLLTPLATMIPELLCLIPVTVIVGYLAVEAQIVTNNMRNDLSLHRRLSNYISGPECTTLIHRYTVGAPLLRRILPCIYT